jgi:hypothetical protein
MRMLDAAFGVCCVLAITGALGAIFVTGAGSTAMGVIVFAASMGCGAGVLAARLEEAKEDRKHQLALMREERVALAQADQILLADRNQG